MLTRGAVFAVVVSLLFALSARELSATPQSRWGQRLKSFFDLRHTSSLDRLKKFGVGTAIAATIGCSALFCGRMIYDFVSDNRAAQSDVMLDTIIRFDDDILGRTFHYTDGDSHYYGEALEWNSPYNKMLLSYFYENRNVLVPVEYLQGKAILWHDHSHARVAFIDPDPNNYLLHGKVMKIFDSDYYYVIADAQEDRDGIVSSLNERRLVFVPNKLITAIEPRPLY